MKYKVVLIFDGETSTIAKFNSLSDGQAFLQFKNERTKSPDIVFKLVPITEKDKE